MIKKKNMILILMLLVFFVGVTIAYFSNSGTIQNIFKTKDYNVRVKEKFESPDNWLPGDTTEKKIYVMNTGEVDEAVRISYTEKWVNGNGEEISGEQNGNKAAIINFSDNSDWKYLDGYYYYTYKLEPGEETSTLIDSVTFNPAITSDSVCTDDVQEGKIIITCVSSGNGYDGATYTLTFIIETVQYNKYKEIWNTQIDFDNLNRTCLTNISDEPVEYQGEEYYIIDDRNSDYVVLIKGDVLTKEEVNACSTSYVSEYGEYPFYRGEGCDEDDDIMLCDSNYNTSLIKSIVDCWANPYLNDLVSVDGYKARLVNEDDMNLRFNFRNPWDNSFGPRPYDGCGDTPDWVYLRDYNYWTMARLEGIMQTEIANMRGDAYSYYAYNVRPVINLKKCAIDNTCE